MTVDSFPAILFDKATGLHLAEMNLAATCWADAQGLAHKIGAALAPTLGVTVRHERTDTCLDKFTPGGFD